MSQPKRQASVQLRIDVEQAAERARALYGDRVTPLGLLMAELNVVAQAAPLWLRLNIEACIATFEARQLPSEPPNGHAPLTLDANTDG